MPPNAASRHASVSSCRTSCARLAPIERRIAISPARAAERASSRFAMFAQAMTSTSAVTPKSSVSGACASPPRRALPSSPGIEHQLAFAEPGLRRLAHPPLQGQLDVCEDRPIGHVQRGRRLFHGHTGLEAGEQVDPVASPVVEGARAPRGDRARLKLLAERDRHEHERPHADRRALEAPRRDADHCEDASVDRDGLAEHARVETVPRLPVAVAQDRHRLAADRSIVARARADVRARARRPSV